MNKLELIQAVKDKIGLSKQEASDVVKLFLHRQKSKIRGKGPDTCQKIALLQTG